MEPVQEVAAGQPSATAGRTRPSRRLVTDLTILGIVGVLLIAALATTGIILYREFYSPTAFTLRYLSLLQEHRAPEALAMPGVAVDSVALDDADLPAGSSDALLRRAAMSELHGITPVSEETVGDITRVTVDYTAQGVAGRTTFEIARDGWIGVVPGWRFAQSPLSVVSLTVRGSMRFEVNGFEVDKRQISVHGVDAAPLDPVPMLVFSPGTYSVTVDTAISASDGVRVLADVPLANTPVDIQAEPTQEFIDVVQGEVNRFLDRCAEQQVLQPTGCPFGFIVQNRITTLPAWSITAYPDVVVEPDGANWRIAQAHGAANLQVEVRSLFDGSLRQLDEDVDFAIDGTITVLPDGTISIRVGSGAELD